MNQSEFPRSDVTSDLSLALMSLFALLLALLLPLAANSDQERQSARQTAATEIVATARGKTPRDELLVMTDGTDLFDMKGRRLTVDKLVRRADAGKFHLGVLVMPGSDFATVDRLAGKVREAGHFKSIRMGQITRDWVPAFSGWKAR